MPGRAFPLVDSLQDLQQRIRQAPALAVWFSAPGCRVCSDLQPKLATLLEDHFPLFQSARVDCTATAEAAARHQVFSVPTLLIYFEGRESLRKIRNLSLPGLAAELQRPYHLLFD